jgi:hypothetical protein
MTDYTDEEKAKNYAMLVDALRCYTTRERITEDWMEEHKKLILRVRDYYTNVSLANLDIQDRQFRSLADDTELILCHLVYEIQTERTFTVDMYYKLCRNLKRMFEIALQVDDLSELFNTSLKF